MTVHRERTHCCYAVDLYQPDHLRELAHTSQRSADKSRHEKSDMKLTSGDANEKSRLEVGVCCGETTTDLVHRHSGSNRKVRAAEFREFPPIIDERSSIPKTGNATIRKTTGA